MSATAALASIFSSPAYGAHTVAKPLVADAIDLPSSRPTTNILDWLPPEDKRRWSSPDQLIDSDAVAAVAPATARSKALGLRSEYIKTARRLLAAGMVRVTQKVRGRVSLFCVPKPENRLRLIVDCRVVNRVWERPASVRLPNPGDIASLIVPEDELMYVGKSDLSSFYYQLLLPEWACDWFVLPPLTRAELGLPGSGAIELCFVVLVMGFSWSVWLGQTVHQSVVAQALRSARMLPSEQSMVVDHFAPIAALYIDDAIVLSLRKQLGAALQQDMSAKYKEAGLPESLPKRVPVQLEPLDLLGVEFQPRTGFFGLAPEKAWRLLYATRAFLDRPRVSGRELAILLGHWIWAALVVRPALAVMCTVFPFCRLHWSRRVVLWRSCRHELTLLMGLLPLLRTNLRAPFAPFVLATDASSTGAGVCAADVSSSVQQRMASVLPALPTPAEVAELRLSFPAKVFGRWRTWVQHRWRAPQESSGAAELGAYFLGVRRSASVPAAFEARLLSLLDAANVIALLQRGRTSAHSMVRGSRTTAAWLLATGMRPIPRFCPTEYQPADGPSRT